MAASHTYYFPKVKYDKFRFIGTHAHTHMHRHTHAHTRTHAHAHMHTHAWHSLEWFLTYVCGLGYIDTFELDFNDPQKVFFRADSTNAAGTCALPCMHTFEMEGSAHTLHTDENEELHFEIIAPVEDAFCKDDVQLLNVCVNRVGVSGNTFTFKVSKLGRLMINIGRNCAAETHTLLDGGHQLLEGILNDPYDDVKFWNSVCAFINVCKTIAHIEEMGPTDDPSKRPVAQLIVLVSICLINSILQSFKSYRCRLNTTRGQLGGHVDGHHRPSTSKSEHLLTYII